MRKRSVAKKIRGGAVRNRSELKKGTVSGALSKI
jgi:hypothetical protein